MSKPEESSLFTSTCTCSPSEDEEDDDDDRGSRKEVLVIDPSLFGTGLLDMGVLPLLR